MLAALGVCLLWWLYRDQPDTIGEMVVDMDDIDVPDWDDDLGRDIDEDET